MTYFTTANSLHRVPGARVIQAIWLRLRLVNKDVIQKLVDGPYMWSLHALRGVVLWSKQDRSGLTQLDSTTQRTDM